MPDFLMMGCAEGDLMKSIRAFAPSGCREPI